MTDTRVIEATVTIKPDTHPDQVEYLIYCALTQVGIPAEPLSCKLRSGSLYCIKDAFDPLKLKYFWFGPDWRM